MEPLGGMGGRRRPLLVLSPTLPGILSRQPFWFLGSFEGSGFWVHHTPAAVKAGDPTTPLQAPLITGKQPQGAAESSGVESTGQQAGVYLVLEPDATPKGSL